MKRVSATLAGVLAAVTVLTAQSKTPPPARRSTAPTTTQESAVITCPSELGVGVRTKVSFCDVLTGRDPSLGVIVGLPPHRGSVTLRFDLHNRHTYSDDEMRSNHGFAAYTATIGVMTFDNNLLSRAIVFSEFRRAQDLLDRIGGGAGPGGVKAVAPLGAEAIEVTIPEGVDRVSLLGEKLTVIRADGAPATYAAPGRPIAVISSATIEYRPPPPVPAPRRR